MIGKTALLVIDAQVGIVEGPRIGPVFEKDAMLRTIKTLIAQARNHFIPVIYIQDLDVAGVESEEFQIHPELTPIEGEQVLRKKATDAFHLTGLHDALQALQINHLVVTGCKTEYCIDTTCRKATTLGYDVTLVQDGHSTTDNSILKADQIIAHHNTVLHGLDNVNNFILVRTSKENVFDPAHNQYR